MNHRRKFVLLLAISLSLILFLVGCYIMFSMSSFDKKVSNLSKRKYKVDEVVEVLVGENISEMFYVVDDSNGKLTLLSQNILFACPFDINGGNDFESSSLKKSLLDYTSSWVYPEKIRLLSIEEFEKGILGVEFQDDDLYSSSNYSHYLSLQKNVMNDSFSSYWLDGSNEEGYVFQVSIADSGKIQRSSVLSTTESGVRVVIVISKEFVK